ncbi:hypothetical protein CLV40_102406 [Actinokineospora auranticolor]|uniref:Uncharacterized protein n=1 Tax=Actinokineospora auranticolor TaxID=155976 RepID=A0A2S6GZA4_9PSEU|nr:hypothetical protein CLV40_102406 [Actinokineospora auranticolor]
MAWYLHDLERALGPDRGLGDGRLRRELTDLLRNGLSPDGQDRRKLIELLPAIQKNYLTRWADSVDSSRPPSAERLAKAVATHLLDCGHSSGQLHRWVRAFTREPQASLADLLDSARELADRVDQEFEVIVPFISVPEQQLLVEHLREWLSPDEASAWFKAQNLTNPERQNGAFRYRVSAKDAVADARTMGGLVRRMENRWSYSRRSDKTLRPCGKVWVMGAAKPLPLLPPPRGVAIPSLMRERTMFDVQKSDRLDEALELAAPLDAGPSTSAVTGAWAAIEALLFHPGDKAETKVGRAVAGDRLAAITACSWPRAELTALSYQHQPPAPDKLSEDLANCPNNQRRSEVVANALGNTSLVITTASDSAAADRMTAMVQDPQPQLESVRRVFRGIFRRLYRQRNIVAHGGSTGGVALEAALRTAAPLVGAGLDRIVHAKLAAGVKPLALAAGAENSLALVGDAMGQPVTGLLG